MIERTREIIQEFLDLQDKLSDPQFILRKEEYTAASKRFAKLRPLYDKIQALEKVEKDAAEYEKSLEIEDSDLTTLAKEELPQLLGQKEVLAAELNALLEGLEKGVSETPPKLILEVRAGVGGEEAALFAQTLLRMYKRYAERRNWPVKTIDEDRTTIGGIKDASIEVTGEEAWSVLKHEAGVH
ncbi:MAG: PCRF domain-containing protein, partial [Parcubacteria group bacterium]|nr:PCRF domain-containing protein [Parcubacteria group bacterium]